MKAIQLSGFGISALFRLGLSGIILAIAFEPLILANFDSLQEPEKYLSMIVLSMLFFGWLISLLDMHIYMLFEGRRYWPERLFDWGLKREMKRLDRLKRRAEALEGKNERRQRYLETHVDLSLFPLDKKGERTAVMPTRLGNIIAEYETYPKQKYDLDAVFFFDRIWLSVGEDLRDEFDKKQAQVDAALYVSFSLVVVAFIFLLYFLFGQTLSDGDSVLAMIYDSEAIDSQDLEWRWLIKSALCLCAAYLIYRISLQAHIRFGSTFKALFDQHSHHLKCTEVVQQIDAELGEPGLASESQRAVNMSAWRYLRWHKVRLPGTRVNRNFEDLKSEHLAASEERREVQTDGRSKEIIRQKETA